MKILMVQNIDGVAGSERYLLQIIPMLIKNGFVVEFLVFQPLNPSKGIIEFTNELNKRKIKFFTLNRQILSLLKLKRIIEKGNFNIVHSHLIHADFYVSIVSRLSRRKWKFVSTKHGFDENYMEKYGLSISPNKSNYIRIARFAEKKVDKSIAVSFGLKNVYEGLGIKPKEGISVIYHGLSIEEQIKPKELSISKIKKIAILGRLVPLKGHKVAIDYIVELNKKIDASLDIVGDGILLDDLINYAKEKKINEKINFIGYTKTPEYYISNADLIILPSKAEGFGLVLIEAMNQGIPVISFDAPAMNEIIEDGINGYLVIDSGIDEMVRKTVQILSDKNLYHLISKNALNAIKTKFNIEEKFQETIAFYKGLK